MAPAPQRQTETKLTHHRKKVENHAAAVAIHFMHYSFGRPHKTLASRQGRSKRVGVAGPAGSNGE